MLLHGRFLSPDLALGPLRCPLPITAQVLRRRTMSDRIRTMIQCEDRFVQLRSPMLQKANGSIQIETDILAPAD